LSTYGAKPSSFVSYQKIQPVVSVTAKVVLVKKIPKGHGVSYGRTYIAEEDKKIALVDIGYGEGYSRKFSSKGVMLIRGKRVDVLGRVTMDLTMIDVSLIKDVVPGEEVVIIGRQENEVITVEEMALSIDTIPYELYCNMGKILPREYSE
jgi:alanine racemase